MSNQQPSTQPCCWSVRPNEHNPNCRKMLALENKRAAREAKSLKHQIAQAIFDKLWTIDNGKWIWPFGGKPVDVIHVEFQRVSPLEGQLRVKTRTNGVHYIDIKISEMM